MREHDRLPVDGPLSGASYSAAELSDDGAAVILMDQRRLPEREVYGEFRDADEVAEAIRAMVVRGAPAIGIAAGYGMAVAARQGRAALAAAAERLRAARPTAVNLGWAVDRMRARAEGEADSALVDAMAAEARAIHREDVAACRRMGELGAELLPDGVVALTHCNAGALATGGYGTALGVLRAAYARGKLRGVLADETRPYLQGARLTAWELARDGIPVEIITDGMAAYFMAQRAVGAVVVGADRVARNGDVANKIGTYGLAVLARAHGLPLYVAAPWSTVDLRCPDGGGIPIEERPSDEVTSLAGARLGPPGVRARHPAFDVTPAALVAALVTERGVVAPPGRPGLEALGG